MASTNGQKGELNADELRAVEDDAIADIVTFQEDVGLTGITDGEFRRTYFHIDFLEQLGGVTVDQYREYAGWEWFVESVLRKHCGLTRRTPESQAPPPGRQGHLK